MKTRDEVRRIKREVEGQLLQLPGVTGVDIAYKSVGGKKTDVTVIRIYVEKKTHVKEVRDAIPKLIPDIETEVIVRRFALHSA